MTGGLAPDMPDLCTAKRLLIVRLSSIGDVVHALPVSAALGEAFPHLELTWLVEEMSAEIVSGNPYLKDVIVVPRSRWKRGRLRSPAVWREFTGFLRDLRARRFDVTLDLQGYAKSAVMVLAAGAQRRYGWWRLRDGSGLVSRSIPAQAGSSHRVDRFLDVARALGASPTDVRFPIYIPDVARDHVAEMLQAAGIGRQTRFAVLNPAVGSHPRRWGAQRYAMLVNQLEAQFAMPSVLMGSARDSALCEEVGALAEQARPSNGSRERPLTVSLAGRTSLKELAALLDRCDVHVCGDTGSGHIAAALARPVVSLYGPTDPAYAGPWGQMDNVLSRRDLCLPACSVRGCALAATSGETAQCLTEISVAMVMERIEAACRG